MSVTKKGIGRTSVLAANLRQIEQEKLRLTRELHDTVLQEQIIVLRELDMIISQKDVNQQNKELKQCLMRVREQQVSSIYMLRNFCQKHYVPQLVGKDWNNHIQLLLDRLQLRCHIDVFYRNDWPHGMDGEQSLHIYRIIQELLHNTEKHAAATKIELIMEQQRDCYLLQYRDNGVGVENIEQAMGRSLGLKGIFSRVECLQGRIELVSRKHAGFQCMIRLSKRLSRDSDSEK